MDEQEIEEVIEQIKLVQVGRNFSADKAAAEIKLWGYGPPGDLVDAALERLRQRALECQVLKVPHGVSALEYKTIVGEARIAQWYVPMEGVGSQRWDLLRTRMEDNGFESDVIASIDAASTKVLGHLADPGLHGVSKKGLVLGYIQSGKTMNYAATITKAADAGFRFFIVLAGVHNSLRSQTQVRLDRDVIGDRAETWWRLTDAEHDFGSVIHNGGLLLSRSDVTTLVVIKKNAARLRRLNEWLKDVPKEIRLRCPTLIIDDEADQASPNIKAARDAVSAINEHLRKLCELLPSASYVGYTATPFANILIDPTVDDDLFPESFIIDLPRPDGYFGAEKVFGRDAVDDDDTAVAAGKDMIRIVSGKEEDDLRPPPGKEEREQFEPVVSSSLRTAVLWFILTRAVRRLRGDKDKHASMLVHTSQYVAMHFAMADCLRGLLHELRVSQKSALMDELRALWGTESGLVPADSFALPTHNFDCIEPEIEEALNEVKVIVDNGVSTDRLNYETEEPQIVIAVGGGTLSRGLTLEGLVVSYFLRTSRTYDTLMQMGRWFGFWKGYEDLPRVWVTDEMNQNFRFLALVEEEIRSAIRQIEDEGNTPRDVAIRIRQHPDLAITSASKMHSVVDLSLSYAGLVRQTFRFDLKNEDRLRSNMDAGQCLVRDLVAAGLPRQDGLEQHRAVFEDCPINRIISFIKDYEVDDQQGSLNQDLIINYLKSRTDDRAKLWNVAIIGSGRGRHRVPGTKEFYEPGTITFGDSITVIKNVRSRLANHDGPANIKALMSPGDLAVDLKLDRSEFPMERQLILEKREQLVEDRGLLLLYPIAGDSVPLRPTPAGQRPVRAKLGAPNDMDVLGYGVYFPHRRGGKDAAKIDEQTYKGLPDYLFGRSEINEMDDSELDALNKDCELSMSVDADRDAERLGQV